MNTTRIPQSSAEENGQEGVKFIQGDEGPKLKSKGTSSSDGRDRFSSLVMASLEQRRLLPQRYSHLETTTSTLNNNEGLT
ncbi:hypothetical protein MUK42_33207 [Musa troglodytarum]|uniref:Uncharacterized protein n=1 Tax=Musa troglodytarum TaxID=320322 RepID=A0A9E7FAB1_9LILI|nr:hypothetical protein MUK42_33207 [Musa troglodytarum]